MPWYKTGTVKTTINSNAIIGTGTAFISNSRVGDAFRGPDGNWYEVVNIASDTAMSISPNYQGPTVAAGTYSIAPMQGYVKESADRLRQTVESIGATLALFGGATNVTQLRTNIGAAQNGTNSDITNITGLTTALSIAQGGTGAKTAPLARTALGLGTAATLDAQDTYLDNSAGKLLRPGAFGLGTDGQTVADLFALPGSGFYYSNPSGGTQNPLTSGAGSVLHVHGAKGFQLCGGDNTLLFRMYTGNTFQPTRTIYHNGNAVGSVDAGAIVEMGSSALGEWTKFAGGLLIMRTVATTTPSILANAITSFLVTLPTALAVNNGTESIVPTLTPILNDEQYGAVAVRPASTTTSTVVIRNGPIPQGFIVKLLVIGRWK